MGLDGFVMEDVGMKVLLMRAEHAEVAFNVEPWQTTRGLLIWASA